MGWKTDREDEFLLLKIGIAAVFIALTIAGLIEWNARRQAAAMTRELLRPATPEEQAQLAEMEAELTRQVEADAARLRRQLRRASEPPKRPRVDTRPLAADERCISGQRFRRILNGWEEIGTCR